MKKTILILTITLSLLGVSGLSYAGDDDWATAGKVLTVLEGLRVISGGKLDLIGGLVGIDRDDQWPPAVIHTYSYRTGPRYKYTKRNRSKHKITEKVWVPGYGWVKKQRSKHKKHDSDCGEYGFCADERCYYNGG